ncbi:MAG: cytochrome c oxidase assembly protein [Ktedonobacteraceae bacterium]|nr:cytochrome c oxidase assembly protein [Ktedonobacteraceae bacterium]
MSIWVDANGWPFPPLVLLGCLIAEILYFRGWHVLVKHAQAKEEARAILSSTFIASDKGEAWWNSWLWRGIFFISSLVVFLLAASAPIDILSGKLFWMHMVQHLLLLIIMAPLLVASAPYLPMWLGLPRWARRFIKAFVKPRAMHTFHQIGHWLRQPAVSCALLIVGVWIWHWPPLYDLALTNDIIHDWCEHLTFLLVSILFWTQIIASYPLRPRLSNLGRLGLLGIAIVQNVVLAVVIGFAQVPLYIPYIHVTIAGGFSTLQDQQFGAGIMWTFGDIPFGLAISVIFQHWLASQFDDTNEQAEITAQQ